MEIYLHYQKNDIIIYSNPMIHLFLRFYHHMLKSRKSILRRELPLRSTAVAGENRSNNFWTRRKIIGRNFKTIFISKSSGFFNPLKYRNVSSVDLSQGDLNLTYQFTGIEVSNNTLQINLDTEPDFQTLPEVSWKDVGSSYQLAHSDGRIIPVNRGSVTIAGRQISI